MDIIIVMQLCPLPNGNMQECRQDMRAKTNYLLASHLAPAMR